MIEHITNPAYAPSVAISDKLFGIITGPHVTIIMTALTLARQRLQVPPTDAVKMTQPQTARRDSLSARNNDQAALLEQYQAAGLAKVAEEAHRLSAEDIFEAAHAVTTVSEYYELVQLTAELVRIQ